MNQSLVLIERNYSKFCCNVKSLPKWWISVLSGFKNWQFLWKSSMMFFLLEKNHIFLSIFPSRRWLGRGNIGTAFFQETFFPPTLIGRHGFEYFNYTISFDDVSGCFSVLAFRITSTSEVSPEVVFPGHLLGFLHCDRLTSPNRLVFFFSDKIGMPRSP